MVAMPDLPSPPRRLMRSRRLVMTSLMAGASVSLTACDNPAPANWSAGNAARPVAEQGAPVDAFAYRTLDGCKRADEIPDDQCETAYKAALADEGTSAPRYDARATCEEVYGAGQCVPRSAQGGSFWGPLVTGFVVGRMLDGGWRGTGLYRDGRDGGYYTGYGGRLDQDFRTGRTRIGSNGIDPPAAIKQAPPKIQTRTSVLSRGGFGGRMSASSSSGRWGG
jgi:uncharacterized protein YgiB involved in biofilm formation